MTFSETATAVYGVYFKLQGFAFLPIIGMNNGMVPIIAYNYGARKPARIMQTIKLAIAYAVGIMVVAVVVFQIFPVQLLGVFQASEEMLAIGVPALRTLSLCFLVGGFTIVASSVFQALGEGAAEHVHLYFPPVGAGAPAGLPVFPDGRAQPGLVVLPGGRSPGWGVGGLLSQAGLPAGDPSAGAGGLPLLIQGENFLQVY